MDLARTFDYAVLKPDATHEDLLAAIALCRQYNVGNLCVKSADVAFAKEHLAGSQTALSAVVGFPHGNTLPQIKAAEAALACSQGAKEIDMVVTIARIKMGDEAYLIDEISQVANAVHHADALLKVIIETALLTPEEMVFATHCVIKGGGDFVKTSTGFAAHGATPEAVQTLVKAADGRIQVKASGGIRTRQQALGYLAMGATRLGVGTITNLLQD